MGVGSALMGFFGLVWRILEGIRRVLHLVLLLVIFGFILAALHTAIPIVPRTAALVVAPTGTLVEQLSGDALSRAVAQARPTCQSRPSGSDQTDARTAFGGPNESKQNQINPRKKAWFSLDSFGRIQTFQRVTENPNKKIFPRFIVCLSLGAGLSSAGAE